MDFKDWLLLKENSSSSEELAQALQELKDNPHDTQTKEKFFEIVKKFITNVCVLIKCDNYEVDSKEVISRVYTSLLSKMYDPATSEEYLKFLIPSSFAGYLSTMVRHAKIDASRRAKSQKKYGGVSIDAEQPHLGGVALGKTLSSTELSPEAQYDRKETSEVVRNAISKLNARDQELANMIYYRDLKYHEIADLLGIPLGTVKSRVSALHQKLRDSLSISEDS